MKMTRLLNPCEKDCEWSFFWVDCKGERCFWASVQVIYFPDLSLVQPEMSVPQSCTFERSLSIELGGLGFGRGGGGKSLSQKALCVFGLFYAVHSVRIG